MSGSLAAHTNSIPVRKIVVNDPSQMPTDYSTTPGGTLFSTTPGGTRIIYDRTFLLKMRNSPLARSPPKNLPSILTARQNNLTAHEEVIRTEPVKTKHDGEATQFEMDL